MFIANLDCKGNTNLEDKGTKGGHFGNDDCHSAIANMTSFSHSTKWVKICTILTHLVDYCKMKAMKLKQLHDHCKQKTHKNINLMQ